MLGDLHRRSRRESRLRSIRKREPIFRGKSDSPYVAGKFEFERHLEKLAHGARALNPSDAAPHGAGRLAGLGMGHFQRHPHIFEDVVLRLVAAAVAIDDERRGALAERTSQRIDAGDHQRDRLHNARAAAFAQFGGSAGYPGHSVTRVIGKIPAEFVHESKPPINCESSSYDCFVREACDAWARCSRVKNDHASLATQIGPTNRYTGPWKNAG